MAIYSRRYGRRACAPQLRRLRLEFLEQRALLASFQLVADINPGSASSSAFDLTSFKGASYFPADDGAHRFGLWKSDGTTAGTALVKDTFMPGYFTQVGGSLFFRSNQQGSSDELWKTDGTPDGTIRLLVDGSSITVPKTMANVNGTLFFPATDNNGTELWKSDGTVAGTVLVKDIYAGSSGSTPRMLTNVNGTLFFVANDGVGGDELWKSDGTAAGTVMVKDIMPGSGGSSPAGLLSLGSQLIFGANDGVSGLWKSDGSATGTVPLLRPFTIDVTNIQEFPVNFANINGTLFFSGSDGVSGNELWKTDGTTAGTQLVKDVIPGAGGSGKSDFMNVNGTLYFVTADNVDWGLWKTDGTAAGTVLVKEGAGGDNSFFPSMLTNVNGRLYFTASDADRGMQIWTSNGTTAGTVRLSDSFAKQLHVNEFRLSNTNGTLLFAANDGTHGSELWKLGSDTSPPPTMNQPPGGTDKTITLGSATSYTLSIADFGFSDANQTPPNNILAVKIATLPVNGSLAVNGVAAVAGQSVSAADIAAGKLVFATAAGTTGNTLGSFTFQVQDDGGTASGGIDLDATPNTLTFVTSVPSENHAPSGTDKTLPLGEDQSYVFTAADFGFSDPNDNPPNAFQAVKFTAMPTGGVGLYLSGIALVTGQVVAVADIAAGKLSFTPPQFSGGNFQFSFQVQDSGGTLNGGVNLDSTPNYFSPMVGFGTSLWHNTTNRFDINGDNGNLVKPDLDLLHNFLATNGPTQVPTSGPPGPPFYDVSGDGYVDMLDEVLFRNGLPENHAPIGVNRFLTTAKNVPYTFSSADFPLTDPNNSPPNTLAAVKIATLPTLGSLLVNGVPATAGQYVPLSAIAGGAFVFTPALDATGYPAGSFTFQVEDNGGTAGGAIDLDPLPKTIRFTIPDGTAVNHAPSGTDFGIQIIEDSYLNFDPSFFGFSDAGDLPPNNFLAVKITTVPALGSFTLSGAVVTAGQTVTVASLRSNLLRWTPPPNVYASNYTNFTFQVQDDGGTANGGVDLDPTPNVMRISVLASNDPPSGADRTVTVAQNAGYVFTAADFPFSDANDTPPNSLLAIKITTVPASGQLSYNNVAAIAGQFIPASALASGAFRFTPAAGATGPTSFTFQLQDNGGTVNAGRDLDPTSHTITINIGGDGGGTVNHAPSGTDRTVTLAQDTAHVISPADFGFSDAADSPANHLKAVKITTLPASGTLTVSGAPITAGQFILVADLAAGMLRYVPAVGGLGSPYANFAFQVEDDGGTANGGIDLDPTPNTLTFNVVFYCGCPFTPGTTISLFEDTSYVFNVGNFPFDPTSETPHDPTIVQITSLPAAGSLQLFGQSVVVGQQIAASDIAAGNLRFLPAANAFGNPYAAFTYRDQDISGSLSAVNTVTINVTPVNDAPAGLDKVVTTLEDTAYTLNVADFGFVDLNDQPSNSFRAVKIAAVPNHGILMDNNIPVVAGTIVPVIDLLSGQLRYVPEANGNGPAYAAFSFQVQDDGGTVHGGQDTDPTPNTLMFNVVSVNDAPSGFDSTRALSPCGATSYTFSMSDFGFADPNDNPPNAMLGVKITTLPSAGSLTLAGMPVNAGDFVAAAILAAGQLQFTPPSGMLGPIASFAFQVKDNGGTANGGQDLDATPNTMTFFAVAPPGSPTVFLRSTVTTREDVPYVFGLADFSLSNADGSLESSVTITALPAIGTLTDNGIAVVPGQPVLASDVAQGRLIFTPTENANGQALATIGFQLSDSGGICGIGSNGLIIVNVAPVNDAPSGAGRTIAMPLDGSYVVRIADFGFTDSHDSPSNAFRAVVVSALPVAGTLTDNGLVITAGTSVPAADVANGRLVFTPGPHASGSPYASFAFQVQDDGGTANSGVDLDPTPHTLTFNVVNPHPWHNALNPLDVNADGHVNGDDAHVLWSFLNTVGSGPVPTDPQGGPPYYDVTDDGFVSPSDFLTVLTTLPNTPPTFAKGVDQRVTDESGPQSIAAWATAISAGADYESLQHVVFVLTVDQPGLFTALPAIDATGRLTFTPAPNSSGDAVVTVVLHDDGGTANGGVDSSQPQTFGIHIEKLHPLHNTARPMDVDGDGHVAPGDVLDIINYINARYPSGQAVGESQVTQFYDVDGDGFVSPQDALKVINHLNALPRGGEGESATTSVATAGDAFDDVIELLAMDSAEQQKPRRAI